MKVLFFAGLRETMGTDAIEIALETPITIGALNIVCRGLMAEALPCCQKKRRC